MKYTEKHFEIARSYILNNEMPEWLLGFKTIIMGEPGAGKTSSLVTLLKMGFKLYGLFTEQGVGNFMKAAKSAGCTDEDMKRFHFAYVPPGVTGFDQLQKSSKAVQLAAEFGKMENGSRAKYGQLIQCINVCNNFVDQNGVEHGSIENFKCNQVFFVDGMSGLARMAMQLTVGAKPVKTLQEWGVAIETLENFENQITTIRAPFVLIAHIERETDEVSRNVYITIATLGSKYPLRIGRNYHDVVMAQQKAGVFTWQTASKDAQLKGTYLPIDKDIVPDFRPLVCQWLNDNGIVDFK